MPAAFVLEVALKSTALLLVTAGLLAGPLRGASAAIRHFTWTIGLVLVLLLPAAVAFGPSWRLAVIPPAWMGDPSATPARELSASEGGAPASAARRAVRTTTSAADASSGTRASLTPRVFSNVEWPMVLLWTWIAGTAVGVIRLVAGLGWAAVIASRADRLAAEEWQAAVARAAAALGLRRTVPALITGRTRVPVACGILRPTLLLPPEAMHWDPERRHIVLLHELSHVKRRDCFVQAVAQAACAVHWYNPLAWLASRGLRAEQERASDDLVLGTGVGGHEYALLLHDILGAFRASAFPGWTTLAMARPSQFEGRVRAILDGGRRRRPMRRRSAWAMLAFAIAAGLPFAALQLASASPADTHARPDGYTGTASTMPAQRPEARAEILAATELAAARRPQVAPKASPTRATIPDPDIPEGMSRISDVELASQLSFFLWSSIPDDELLNLAVRNRLGEPAQLERQVRRMLRDERSKALVANFFDSWLSIRNLSKIKPDPAIFPEWDEPLRASMQQETELFLHEQLHDDRSVVDLLTADYTFVNERLARHYGIPNVTGDQFRRVTYPDARRGGILGHASVLSVTSFGNRTSPVVRGKWIRETLLGVGTPPPPANVPPLREQEADSGRGRLERHRRNPVCASCHQQMDPIGFALENFDALGQWRETDAGFAIDASGTFPDGAVFNGPAELRTLLVNHRASYLSTVTEKLLAYALGRSLATQDMPVVRRIVREAEPAQFRWSAIVEGIVESAPFQLRPAS